MPNLRSLFEPNPVFKRELRVRWRRPAAFLMLLFYVTPLIIGMTWLYKEKTRDWNSGRSASGNYITLKPAMPVPRPRFQSGFAVKVTRNGIASAAGFEEFNTGDQLAEIGRGLFHSFTLFQVIAWLLIAPALTAPMIAMERERGLLEALQLANLPPRRVVLGKWLSALGFLILLLIVPLPVTAVLFFFGGFTQEEFLQAATLIAMAALCGTAWGLFCSSRARRPIQALTSGFAILAVVSVILLAKPLIDRNAPRPVRQAVAVLELAHPYIAAQHFETSEPWRWPLVNGHEEDEIYPLPPPPVFVLAPPPEWIAFDWQSSWLLHIALQGALTLLFLLAAMRAASRPLPDVSFARRHLWTEKWRARREAGKAARVASLSARALQREEARLANRAQDALLREIPFLSGRSFDNPVLGRELRGKARWRSLPAPLQIAAIIGAIGAVALYVYALGLASVGEMHNGWLLFSQAGLTGLTLYAGAAGAGAFSRERENGTWESLRLSLIAEKNVVSGKFWPILAMSAVLSLPLWPALLACGIADPRKNYDAAIDNAFGGVFAVFFLIAGTIPFVAACGLSISWFCRKTPTATGVIIGSLLVLFVILPALCGAFHHDYQGFFSWCSPAIILWQYANDFPLSDAPWSSGFYPDHRASGFNPLKLFSYVILFWALTSFVLFDLARFLKLNQREDKA